MTGALGGRRSSRPLGRGSWAGSRRSTTETDGPAVARSSRWWPTVAVTCLLLHPYLTVPFLDSLGQERLAVAGHVCVLLANLALLCAALVLMIDARLTDSRLRASMATAATIVAVEEIPLVALAIADPSLGTYTHRLTLTHVCVALVVLAVVTAGRSGAFPRRLNPLFVGLVLGMLVLVPGLVVHELGIGLLLRPDRPGGLAMTALLAAALGAIWVQLLRTALSPGVVHRIGLGALAIFAARLGSALSESTQPQPLVVVGIAAFSALVLSSALSLLRGSMSASAAVSRANADRAAIAEAAVRHDREMAHEVRAATAGIVAGAHLLASGRVPPGRRRAELEHMVDVEAARLGRSLVPQSSTPSSVAVDDVIGPLLVAQGALGHDVRWEPGGHVVHVRRDDLAEVLSVLLNNAARHGLRRGTRVESRQVGDRVEIRVSDKGPGISPEVSGRLFEWGARGPYSGGEGIGLQSARRLLRQYGGQLDVERSIADVGTVFVARLRSGHDQPSTDGTLQQEVGLAR